MKDKGKLSKILSCVLFVAVYIILGVAIIVESKWAYALVLLSAILTLCLLWKERFNILKLWAIIMLSYSVLVLIGWDSLDIVEKTNNNPLVVMYLLLAELLTTQSKRIIMFILVLGSVFVKPIFKAYRIALSNVIYGPLPDVRGIVRENRKVYLSYAYKTGQVQVIFRNGSKKKILDAYEAEREDFMNPEDHYSLEWEEEKELIVRKYNVYNHEVIMERQYKVPKY